MEQKTEQIASQLEGHLPPTTDHYRIRQLNNKSPSLVLCGGYNWAYYAAPVLASTYYIFVRLTACVKAQAASGSPILWLAWAALACEVVFFVDEINAYLELGTWMLSSKRPGRPKFRLEGSTAPTVDVLITVCGEDVDIILDTIKAAADQDYPATFFRIIVSDDANRKDLSAAINELNRDRSPEACILYLSRPKTPGQHHFYKSGNNRYCFEKTDNLHGRTSEFVAAVDADMITERHWLSSMVPHLILDPSLAAIQPCQYSYHFPHSEDIIARDFPAASAVQIGITRDLFGFAQINGSGYVVRRAAVDGIGGFPLMDISEDVHFSYTLLEAGWKIGFVDDAVQHGMSAPSLHAFIDQRCRWVSSSQVIRRRVQ